LKVLGTASLLAAASPAAAAPPSSPVPIVTSGGTRLYPSNDADRWWEPQPIINQSWTLPQVIPPSGPPPEYVLSGFPSIGTTSPDPDGATMSHDLRNAPRHGVFTRMYQQLVTRPLLGAQTLGGTVSIAVHAYQAHRRLNAALALQVVVHQSDGLVRGVALPVTAASEKFTTDTPPRTRALLGTPVFPVDCYDGDVIAVNVGIWANNETRSLAPGIGFYFYANQDTDIGYLDTASLGNTWVEFSAGLDFYL
jgi:hypothetical protein